MSTKATHLELQRDKLVARRDSAQAALASTDQSLAVALPAAAACLGQFATALHAMSAQRKDALYQDAYLGSAWRCLLLTPLKASTLHGLNAFKLAWSVLAITVLGLGWLLPTVYGPYVAASLGAILYSKLLTQSRRAWARAACASALALLALVDKYQVIAVQVGGTPSGNKDFPYSCVEVEHVSPAYVDRARNFDVSAFGNMYGVALLGLIAADGAPHVCAWIKLGEPGEAARLVDLSAQGKIATQLQALGPALLALASSQADALGTCMRSLEALVAQRRGTVAELDMIAARLQSIASQESAWKNVAISREALDAIIVQIELFRMGKAGAPKGMLLYGPPGTGKTSIARNMAATSGCQFISVNLADLKGQFQGHTAPKVVAAWKQARAKAPCILFIDECEGILGTRSERSAGGSNVNFDNELVEAFLAEWDGVNSSSGQVFLVGATNRRESLDDAVVSRFNQLINIGLPDVHCRQQILELEFSKRSINQPVTMRMAKETAGMAGRDLSNLATSFQGAVLLAEPSEDLFSEVLKQARGKSSTLTDGVSWDQVVLDVRLKQKLAGLARKIKRAEEYLKAGFHIPKSLLLYGPPGTGKTQIARAMSTESGLAFQAVTTGEIKGMHVGESSKLVKRIFDTARAQAPCLLFIDEIDIVTGARGNSDRAGQEIVGQLLQEMDGIKSRVGAGFVFVLAATNCRSDIDPAVLSRFGDQEEIGLPDEEARKAILEVLLKGKPLGFELTSMTTKVAAQTGGQSGRDLGALVNAAAGHAMERADIEGLEIEDIRILPCDFAAVAGTDAAGA